MELTEQFIQQQGFKIYVRNYIENGKSILTLPKIYEENENYYVKNITVDKSEPLPTPLPPEDSNSKLYIRFSNKDENHYLIEWYPPENYIILKKIHTKPVLHYEFLFDGKVKTIKKFAKIIKDYTEFK